MIWKIPLKFSLHMVITEAPIWKSTSATCLEIWQLKQGSRQKAGRNLPLYYLFLRHSFKELGAYSHFGVHFHILLSLHKLEMHELRASVTIQKQLLEMFSETSHVSLRSLRIRAGRTLNIHLGGWGQEKTHQPHHCQHLNVTGLS